ncbi:hypothetical protein [Halospeciosus flavus]|uniref:DUF7835 domain-containing protein n=1 Tax=Halospeciosus flavus TaxID=3032283 RepID=A0ABD5Z8D8_9EURY
MASKTPHSDGMTELCENCGQETAHSVSVELKTESSKSENSEFSREPYRVTECRSCGTETSQRMNNA